VASTNGAVRALLGVDLFDRVCERAAKGQPLLLTGHSLGGAMATLLALELLERTSLKVYLVTFGEPPAGDSALANILRGYTSGASPRLRMRRVALTMDPVPRCFDVGGAAAARLPVGKEMVMRLAAFQHAAVAFAPDSAVASRIKVFILLAERAAAFVCCPDVRNRINAVKGAAIALFESRGLLAYREALETDTLTAMVKLTPRYFICAKQLACSLGLEAHAKEYLGQLVGAPLQSSKPPPAQPQPSVGSSLTASGAVASWVKGAVAAAAPRVHGAAALVAQASPLLNLGMSALTLFKVLRFEGRVEGDFDAIKKRVGSGFDALEMVVNDRANDVEKCVGSGVGALEESIVSRLNALEVGLGGQFYAFEVGLDGRFTALEEGLDDRIFAFSEHVDGRFTALEVGLDGLFKFIGERVDGGVCALSEQIEESRKRLVTEDIYQMLGFLDLEMQDLRDPREAKEARKTAHVAFGSIVRLLIQILAEEGDASCDEALYYFRCALATAAKGMRATRAVAIHDRSKAPLIVETVRWFWLIDDATTPSLAQLATKLRSRWPVIAAELAVELNAVLFVAMDGKPLSPRGCIQQALLSHSAWPFRQTVIDAIQPFVLCLAAAAPCLEQSSGEPNARMSLATWSEALQLELLSGGLTGRDPPHEAPHEAAFAAIGHVYITTAGDKLQTEVYKRALDAPAEAAGNYKYPDWSLFTTTHTLLRFAHAVQASQAGGALLQRSQIIV